MPQPIVEKLNGEIGKALKSTEISERIRNLNLNVFATQASELRPLIYEVNGNVRSAHQDDGHQAH